MSIKNLFKRKQVPENAGIYQEPTPYMRYGKKLPSLERTRNRMRADAARRQGHDTFIDTKGRVRAARTIKQGEKLLIPVDHLALVKKVQT